MQEDESDIALRKAKEEEQLVDIDEDSADEAIFEPTPVLGLSRPQSQRATPAPGTPVPMNGIVEAGDEDAAWAEEDPDDDLTGWKVKIVMEDDEMARY